MKGRVLKGDKLEDYIAKSPLYSGASLVGTVYDTGISEIVRRLISIEGQLDKLDVDSVQDSLVSLLIQEGQHRTEDGTN